MHENLPLILFGLFWIIWLVLAIRPLDRKTWLLENVLIFVMVPVAVWAFRQGLLSTLSVVVIFAFGIMHAAAAHYSYAKTPWGNWFKRMFKLRRNYYDRVVHFLYGFMTVPVANDVLQYQLPANGFTRAVFIFALITAIGALYEIIEFFSVVVLGKNKGLSFLGVQGDIWDAQKDMLMQAIGAVLGLILFGIVIHIG